MTTYGKNFGMIVSDTIKTDGSGEPDPTGNIFYLMAEKVDLRATFDPGITPFYGGISYDVNLGERTVVISLKKAIFQNDAEYNNFSDFIYSNSQEGADHLYVHVMNLKTGTYKYLSYDNSNNVNVPFIKGRITKMNVEFKNNINILKSLEMQESWLSMVNLS